ncbi:DUF6734 family protein [Mucilaginibacter sp. X4EP1]|uniref:DUF6734 family protein n=1 Tax=Mucilaginibacter sp. X4EP1 TaxID=2723092 RepID=UPI002169EB41|nr:DUF6734 family protein [Mucilaginibacter sp. X4EP1]MCS3814807.1 hypothetical protein [Mucilaginibacter sp. X4EP1]
MKFIHTFWTGPSQLDKHDLISMKAGWLSCEYHWMSWALSCLQAKKILGSITLVTDLKGKEILIDKLKLPYNEVSTALETKLDDYPQQLWALAKIYTYSIQKEPFLHLDADVFFWKKPHADLLSSPLIAQNLDVNLEIYRVALNEINEQFARIPSSFVKERYEHTNLYASNAGLLGGSELSFFKDYAIAAFGFINENKQYLHSVNTANLNFIFEQYLFCALAAQKAIPVSYYKGPVNNPVFKDYIKFEDFPEIDMIHPVGGFKKYPHVCGHVAKKLRNDYPEYYYRIIEMVRDDGANMRSAVYTSPFLKLKELQQLETEKPYLKEKKDFFERTKAAIEYINQKNNTGGKSYLSIEFSKIDFEEPVVVFNADDNERLLDIYHLESEIEGFYNTLYINSENVIKLYSADKDAYRRIQQVFSLAEPDLMQIRIKVPEYFVSLNLFWDWKCNHKDEIIPVVTRNFNTEKSEWQVILLPDILSKDITTHYLDELDELIFDLVKAPISIENILAGMQTFFSSEEITENYNSFKSLIIKSLKLMLYSGSITVIK